MKIPDEPKPPAAPVENQNFAGTYELDEAQFADQLVELAPTFALTESKFEKLTNWDSPVIQTAKALLIGNIALLIWLTGPLVRNPNAGPVGWIDIVKANKSDHPMISVIHPAPNRTIVSLKDNILVDCETTGPETAMVRSLDLRPIGLVISGNMTNLTIGMQRFYKNTFQNSTIAFSHKPQPRMT